MVERRAPFDVALFPRISPCLFAIAYISLSGILPLTLLSKCPSLVGAPLAVLRGIAPAKRAYRSPAVETAAREKVLAGCLILQPLRALEHWAAGWLIHRAEIIAIGVMPGFQVRV